MRKKFVCFIATQKSLWSNLTGHNLNRSKHPALELEVGTSVLLRSEEHDTDPNKKWKIYCATVSTT
jgi:hypothetical protein